MMLRKLISCSENSCSENSGSENDHAQSLLDSGSRYLLQNITFKPNCRMRGSSADVILPYVPAVSVLFGSLKLVWLSRLKNSPRNCSFTLSVIGKYFATAKSTLAKPGPK